MNYFQFFILILIAFGGPINSFGQYCQSCFEVDEYTRFVSISNVYKERTDTYISSDTKCFDSQDRALAEWKKETQKWQSKGKEIKKRSRQNKCSDLEIIKELQNEQREADKRERDLNRNKGMLSDQLIGIESSAVNSWADLESLRRRLEEVKQNPNIDSDISARIEATELHFNDMEAKLEAQETEQARRRALNKAVYDVDNLKAFYASISAPVSISNGWHYVTMIKRRFEQPEIIEDEIVYVERNKIKKYLYKQDHFKNHIAEIGSGSIKEGYTVLNYEKELYDVYFIPFLQGGKRPNIKPAGSAVFGTKNELLGQEINIYLEGTWVGKISKASSSISSCGIEGFATLEEIKPGTYSYEARSNTHSWKGEISIKPSECTQQILSFDMGRIGIWSKNQTLEGGYFRLETPIPYSIQLKNNSIHPESNFSRLNIAQTTLLTAPSGKYKWSFIKNQKELASGSIEISSNKPQTFEIKSDKAVITFQNHWKGMNKSNILINGQSLGFISNKNPQKELFLKPGRINYVITNPSHSKLGIKWEGSLDLNANESIKIDLKKPPEGSIMFYAADKLKKEVELYEGNMLVGIVRDHFKRKRPFCGTHGTITVSRPPGVYSFIARSGKKTWKIELLIESKKCRPVRIDR